MHVEQSLKDAGISLPQPMRVPPGVTLSFPWVRIVGARALISGHGPLQVDGSLLAPLGKVGANVSEAQAYVAARATTLAMLSSLKSALGDLDRIQCWVRIFGMVNAAPGFNRFPPILDGCTDLLFQLFGRDRGLHARSAIGVAGLPFDIPVEIEGEVLIDPV